MAAGGLPPTLLVGIHSSSATRGGEYLPGVNPESFSAHERFFVDDVARWARSELRAAPTPDRCGVFGFSNGGAFAVALGNRHPDKFGVVIAFSVARGPAVFGKYGPQHARAQRYYLAAGRVGPERAFRKNTLAVARMLQRRGVAHVWCERAAGHEFGFWEEELPLAIAWVFGGGPASSCTSPAPE
jgi:enterochelin esterase-like enzyme